MKQVLFETTESSSVVHTYIFSKGDLSMYLTIEYSDSSFLIHIPDSAKLPTDLELQVGVKITDYVDWEIVDEPASIFSVKAHIPIKISHPEYLDLTKKLVSYYNSGGIDRILKNDYKLEDELIRIKGKTDMLVGEVKTIPFKGTGLYE